MIRFLILFIYIILLFIIALLYHKNKGYKNRITGKVYDAILTHEELIRHGMEVAQSHSVNRRAHSCSNLQDRMEQNYKFIIKTYKELNSEVAKGNSVDPAAEWLFDNFYIIEEQVKDIRQNFPSGPHSMLPCLKSGLLKGFPRIYDIALEIISHTDGRIDEKLLYDFLKSYQSKSQLVNAELWAVPVMLKVALIENLRHICGELLCSNNDRKKAEALADSILLGCGDPDKLLEDLKSQTAEMGTLSPAFAERLLMRIKRHGCDIGPIVHYIDEVLSFQGTSADEIIRLEHQQQAANQVSIGNSITSMRLISGLDWHIMFENLSSVEQTLRLDPAGVYKNMDFKSRDYYHHAVEHMSKRFRISEAQVAKKAVECAQMPDESADIMLRHVGYYIVDNGREKLELELGYRPGLFSSLSRSIKNHPSFVYLFPIIFFSCSLSAALGLYGVKSGGTTAAGILLFILCLFPVSEIIIGIVNWITTHVLSPAFLPKYEYINEIPEDCTTIVVIPALISNKNRVSQLMDELEVYYLANSERNIYFALLGDFADAKNKDMPGDEEVVKCGLECALKLNKKYSKGENDLFYFFQRYREYNPSQGVWMGWERKRGKLVEFNRLLRGSKDTAYYIQSGDISKLPKVKYVITLDADTVLPRETARMLIGAISHPLNKAVVDMEKLQVVRGFGILQPRIGIDVVNAGKSLFSRIFAGQGGIDPYTTAVSDVYMDLFGEGIYTGKGIYDVDVFSSLLDSSIPENAVLSHDLLEGSYARTALVTDIELIDGFPAKYSSYAARLHRWVRGDWQLILWLKRRVIDSRGMLLKNNLSIINRWKIFDNLRRSLMPADLVLLILLSFVLPGAKWVWLGLSALAIAFPVLCGVANMLLVNEDKNEPQAVSGLKNVLLQILLLIIFLPYKAYMMSDAIIRTLYRVFFSRKKLLEWETAADAEVRLKNSILSYIKSMWISPVIAAALVIICSKSSIMYLPIMIIPAFLWIISPYAAFYVSRVNTVKRYDLSGDDIAELRRITRKTWRYFEEFVGEKGNYLPPDNYQLEPKNGAAYRTSPTNIGLYLVSAIAARDMGYISTLSMVEHLKNTLCSIDKLDRWKGHFYNWYDIANMQPLKPLYISTVDSGNLVGYLMTFAEGLKEYKSRPIIDRNYANGLMDLIKLYNSESKTSRIKCNILESLCGSEKVDPILWNDALDEIADLKSQLEWAAKLDTPYSTMIDDSISMFKNEISSLMPWVKLLKSMPDEIRNAHPAEDRDLEIAASGMEHAGTGITCDNASECSTLHHVSNMLCMLKNDVSIKGLISYSNYSMSCINDAIAQSSDKTEILKWLKDLKSSIMDAYLNLHKLQSSIKELLKDAKRIVAETDFRPLFDQGRQLFSIGYSVEEERLNRSYYDLLASEARQTSFISIAKGDIDQKHWFKLGRSMTRFENYRGLVSWSGTMFEYLMPLLIMRNYENTMLDNAYNFAVQSQIGYGKMRNVPWGVSESAFAAFDINRNYQYKAFGVPRLGLKRGLSNDIVVAPYASILALMVSPKEAVSNLKYLKSEGLDGPYGFFEACDYTTERIPAGKKNVIIKSFMVHHHGMSMLALDNVINNNIMQNRFHNNPSVKATELLLQEKVPGRITLTKDIENEETPAVIENNYADEFITEISDLSVFPESHILSNGSLFTVLTDRGSGFTRLGKTSITRFRENSSTQDYGMFIYIQCINSNEMWSAAYEPCRVKPENYKVIFSSDKAEYQRTDGNIDTHTDVVISPEENVEIRRVSLTNHSKHSRVIEVTSYFEVVISSQGADEAHPAFNNLFVKTKFDKRGNALLASRRPRESNQKTLWLMHKAVVYGEAVGAVQYETDRMKFIGRGRNLSSPEALDPGHPLSNTSGAVLDPVMSLRWRVKIKPGETVQISYITACADSKEDALKLADKYDDGAAVKRAFELAWTRSQVEAKYLGLKSKDIELYQKMLSHILFISPLRRNIEDILKKNTRGQSGLWPYGISGDVPIILLAVKKDDELDIVEYMLKAHEYWRIKGLKVDLCILNEDPGDYMQTLANKIRNMIYQSHAADIQDRPGGVFLRQADMIDEAGVNLLYSAARLVLKGDNGPIRHQIKFEAENINDTQTYEKEYGQKHDNAAYAPSNLQMKNLIRRLKFWNGTGGFDKSASEYVIILEGIKDTPAPWSNVICNEKFGFLITSSGGGYTWSQNSRENKLSPWSNDPVIDPSSEVLYLKDMDENKVWSITPHPVRESEPYIIRHGFGYTVFEHTSHNLAQVMTLFVPKDQKVKIIKVKLKNLSAANRKLSLSYYMRPVLGVSEKMTAPFIVTSVDDASGLLLVKNSYNDDFPQQIVFLDCSVKAHTVTGDALEFLGVKRDMSAPSGLLKSGLSGHVGAGYDPCAVVMANVELKPNEEKIFVFTLGEAENIKDAEMAAAKYRDIYSSEAAFREVKGFWGRIVNTIQVDTPDESLNLLANGWLIYQTICCRMWARSAFYQAGGAYGFRDQLQDSMAAAYVLPEITKKQIILHSSHQYLEGDVQHWWHPVSGKGIRTRFSDDLLWLPYVTADYINVTGDNSILDIETPYIEDRPLGEDEDERYNSPAVSKESDTVYRHCIKSIDKALKFGSHGIPLIGSGDWNDGMNTVGNKGLGESIWLGWFLYKILLDFAPVCSMKGEDEKAESYKKYAVDIKEALQKNGWDGSWYRRAYFDDGKPLGSASNSECMIDSIAQSWAVISNAGSYERIGEAMRALEQHLINYDAGLIKLLSPPFDKGDIEPGYIKAYVPGVRENGGQYTHAAVWVILAYAMLGNGGKAWELFKMINPVNHTSTVMECSRYRVEPYVMAADVCAVEPHTGRGGWTWYTGAAGWMYRVCIEHMLGLKLKGSSMEIEPCIPDGWSEYTIKYRYMDTLYIIGVKNKSGPDNGIIAVTLDNKLLNKNEIPLVNDKAEHKVDVII